LAGREASIAAVNLQNGFECEAFILFRREEKGMSMEERHERKAGISGRIRESFEGSWRSLSKIEAEGEKLVRGLVGLMEKYGVDASTKAVDDLRQDARDFLKQLNESFEESAEKFMEGLNVPTREDLDQYNRKVKALIDENVKSRLEKLKVPTGKDLDVMSKQLRGSLEEQVRKGLGRLNLATREELDAVAKDLKKLRQEVAKLHKSDATKTAKPAAKKPASAKAATARKTAAKTSRKKQA
jgi:BMFP domain-containing protein YqiC